MCERTCSLQKESEISMKEGLARLFACTLTNCLIVGSWLSESGAVGTGARTGGDRAVWALGQARLSMERHDGWSGAANEQAMPSHKITFL